MMKRLAIAKGRRPLPCDVKTNVCTTSEHSELTIAPIKGLPLPSHLRRHAWLGLPTGRAPRSAQVLERQSGFARDFAFVPGELSRDSQRCILRSSFWHYFQLVVQNFFACGGHGHLYIQLVAVERCVLFDGAICEWTW